MTFKSLGFFSFALASFVSYAQIRPKPIETKQFTTEEINIIVAPSEDEVKTISLSSSENSSQRPIIWKQLKLKDFKVFQSYTEDLNRLQLLKGKTKEIYDQIELEKKEDPLLAPKGAFETSDQYNKRILDRKRFYESHMNSQTGFIKKEMEELEGKYYVSAKSYSIVFKLENYDADRANWKVNIQDGQEEGTCDINILPQNAKLLWDNLSSLTAFRVIKLTDTISTIVVINCSNLPAPIFLSRPNALHYGNKTNSMGEVGIFEKVEIEASFPGGEGAWVRYLRKKLDPNVPIDNGAPPGTYQVIVKFLVSKDGSISDVQAETDHGYGMEKEALKIIKNGPKWTPASQNNRNVTAYRRQPITFVVTEQ